MLARSFMLFLCVITFTVWGCATTPVAPKTAKDPKEAQSSSYFSRGLLAMNHGNWANAEKYFLEALKIKPQAYNTRLYLAKAYENDGKREEAVGQLREAIKQNSKESRAYSMLMDLYFGSNQTDKAIEAGEEALQNGAGSDSILINLGWSYYSAGDLDKAEARLNAAREESKNNSIFFNDMGLVNFSRDRYEDALTNFKEADRLNPKSVLAPYFLALTYKKLGHEDEAMGALVAGLGKDPQLDTKVKDLNKQFFPHTDPGDISALFVKAKAEAAKAPAPAPAAGEAKPAEKAKP